jgi:hypothetical protein
MFAYIAASVLLLLSTVFLSVHVLVKMILQIVDIAKEILKLQQDFSVVLLGEEHQDQSWLHNDSNVRTLPLLFRWQLWLLPSYCSSFLQCCKVLLQ